MNVRRDFNKPLAGEKRITAAPLVDVMLEGAGGWLRDRDSSGESRACARIRLGWARGNSK
jgi:hypothetical protein